MSEKYIKFFKEIIALAKLGKKIEKHYGKPEDIEWVSIKIYFTSYNLDLSRRFNFFVSCPIEKEILFISIMVM